ncbi:MAG: gluconate 2-dehydrogenase subunit 3 family protein [Adhaeribacter sp.]
MKRRTALRSLALLVGGTMALPAWASNWDAAALAPLPLSLADAGQTALLGELVETIIPASDTPGARELGVHLYILTMLADCYDKPAQARFRKGLQELDQLVKTGYGKPFGDCPPAQRLEILQGREAAARLLPPEQEAFFPFLKSMTIQGYLNSAYVMRDVYRYELVPARFHGCVPVKQSAQK